MIILALLVTSLLVFGVWQIFWLLAWMQSQPYWELSARNSFEGVLVEVYQSDQSEPTYKTLLSGESIPQELTRVRADDASTEGIQTLFYDGTIRPGRWTVMVSKNKIDVMQRAMILNDKEEMLALHSQ